MNQPLCGGEILGETCKNMARWAISVRGRHHLLRDFACDECKNEVTENLTNEGKRIGYIVLRICQIR
ncbi:MAG: hypothetical protein G01um10142_212 [Parcubacteria group bacterium Gr01-1014_2]|nr:MAG: hypothetical protein G01um10142_212 [Parcubacteria group bacterium Gr01-1014_2]